MNFFNSNGQGLLDVIDNWVTSDTRKSLYIDVSKIGTTDEIGGMIIDLITNHLINYNKDKINPFIIFVDEVHRLTAPNELKSIQNHLSENQVNQLRKLNTGEAVLTSINLLKDLYIQVEKCNRLHHNETPSLLHT